MTTDILAVGDQAAGRIGEALGETNLLDLVAQNLLGLLNDWLGFFLVLLGRLVSRVF